ncbi:MAG TPA: MBL fold metallo-hydrolase [Arenicellales bacterium]|nr:MBL fold metallo-hydrolase [Arenicellales bacterium]
MRRFVLTLSGLMFLWLEPSVGQAQEIEVQKVTENVYALVGKRGPMSKSDLGTNATFGVVVTPEGAVLIDPGASRKAAQRIEAAIRSITDQPVVLVINTGAEDHRWLGNGYFKAKGARILAAGAARDAQRARAGELLTRLEMLLGKEGAADTRNVYADEVFDGRKDLLVGGIAFQLRHVGSAYTPGDTYVWLPGPRVVFAGDIISMERMVAVGTASNTTGWLSAFDEIAALSPVHVVPGHGHAGTLVQGRKDTRDYLVTLRDGVKALLDAGGSLAEVGEPSGSVPVRVSDRLRDAQGTEFPPGLFGAGVAIGKHGASLSRERFCSESMT